MTFNHKEDSPPQSLDWKPNAQLLIYGAYGGWNAGDEAIFYSLVEMLRQTGFENKINVACNRVSETQEVSYQTNGIGVVRVRQVFRLVSFLRKCQLIIGGGQVLTGDHSIKGLLIIWFMVAVNRLFGFRPSLIGFGAEGIKSPMARFIVRRIVRRCFWVACRDHYTLDLIEQAVGKSLSHVVQTGDLVFSGVVSQTDSHLQPDSTTIVVSIHASPHREYSSVPFFADLVKEVRKEIPNAKIIVSAHDLRHSFDAGAIESLKQEIDDKNVDYHVFSSLPETLKQYASCTMVISARMHPIIIGMVYGKRVIPIANSNKLKNLADQFELPKFSSQDSPAAIAAEAVKKSGGDHLPVVEQLLARLKHEAYENIKLIHSAHIGNRT